MTARRLVLPPNLMQIFPYAPEDDALISDYAERVAGLAFTAARREGFDYFDGPAAVMIRALAMFMRASFAEDGGPIDEGASADCRMAIGLQLAFELANLSPVECCEWVKRLKIPRAEYDRQLNDQKVKAKLRRPQP